MHRAFDEQDPRTQLSTVAHRVVVNLFDDDPMIVGTATTLGPALAVTAKHILDDLPRSAAGTFDVTISLVQVYPEGEDHEYAVWSLNAATCHPNTDLAILHLDPVPRVSGNRPPWKGPVVAPLFPSIGDVIAGFGYRHSTILRSRRPDGGQHIDISDRPMVGVGKVRELYETGRGFGIEYPCYLVDAPFDRGMSGGPVFDESGALCGIISRGYERPEGRDSQDDATEYVAALWPLFGMLIHQDAAQPIEGIGERFPLHELARNGLLSVHGYEELLTYLGFSPSFPSDHR